jgi:hypothetical protein
LEVPAAFGIETAGTSRFESVLSVTVHTAAESTLMESVLRTDS